VAKKLPLSRRFLVAEFSKLVFRLTEGAVDLDWALDQVGHADVGATVSFLGSVRQTNFGKEVLGLEYQAYPAMVEAEFRAIVKDSAAGLRVALEHSVGSVKVGEATIALAIGAAHRKEAFAAGEAMMNQIKSRLPIWKKELYPDGSSWLGQGS
jgi:molybdopterin synthase catalytic subunit